MKHITLLVLLSTSLVFGQAKASFPDQQSVKQFFDDSDFVAYVRIESGEIHRINGDRCGTRYKVDVLTKFKGNLPTQTTIVMGPSISPAEVGKSYLVFLSKKQGYDRREMTQFIGMPEDFLSKCRTNEVYLNPDILIGEELDGTTESLLVPMRIIAFPDSMTSTSEVSTIGNISMLQPVYVSLDKAFKYLQELGRSKGGT